MIVFKVADSAALQVALEKLTAFLLEAGVSSERVFDSKLVACELVTNELRHGKNGTDFSSEIKDGHVQIKIISKNGFKLPDKIVCSDVFSEHGRGLFLVNELCEGNIFEETDGICVKIRIEK